MLQKEVFHVMGVSDTPPKEIKESNAKARGIRSDEGFLLLLLLVLLLQPIPYNSRHPRIQGLRPGVLQWHRRQLSLSSSTPGTSCAFPGLNLTCQGDKADALLSLITPRGLKLIVKSINYTTQTIKLAIDRNLLVVNNQCPLPSRNITLPDITNSYDEPILSFATNYAMGTFFFRCSTKPVDTGMPNYSGGDTSSYNFTSNSLWVF
ncbi:hypothetical protein EJ110_NYTH00552 [Nymphaea thermarum]|nr:hypothetical protein EJ110_NYTH00552 [Nymphaea thermarum]